MFTMAMAGLTKDPPSPLVNFELFFTRVQRSGRSEWTDCYAHL